MIGAPAQLRTNCLPDRLMTGFKSHNGLEIIELLADHKPIVIFMNINTPGTDGFTATAQIRLLAYPLCTIPAIALMADAMKEDHDRYIQAGMNDCISKPFCPDRLFIKCNNQRQVFINWVIKPGC